MRSSRLGDPEAEQYNLKMKAGIEGPNQKLDWQLWVTQECRLEALVTLSRQPVIHAANVHNVMCCPDHVQQDCFLAFSHHSEAEKRSHLPILVSISGDAAMDLDGGKV